jgi:hypothetical protein
MLTRLVVEVGRSNEMQTNRPDEVMSSDELPVGKGNYLDTFKTGEELNAQGV